MIHLRIWSRTWDHGVKISCPCCKLLDYAMRYYEKDPEVDEGHFYFLNRAAGSTQLHFVSISKLLELSIRKPRVSFPLGPCSYLEGQFQSRTDLSIFRKKFQSCATRHSSCSKWEQPLHQIIGLKVIDCRSRQVIEAPSDCGYVALSYVWGPPSLGTSDDLQDPPKTIADAISVTLGLGLAFLWVDRYCVSQDNKEEQYHQLQQMGLIYKHAQVTIIAAAGNDPTHGLPGISSNRPKRTALTNIGQYAVFPSHKSLQELVSESVWMTRAWTYQEFFFSRRRLWFTDQKAFFDCQEGIQEECAADEWENTNFLARRNNLQDILAFSHKEGIYRTYEIITRYCMRRLTYPSDILNGVLGILSTFEDTSETVHHVCGMPYSLKEDNPQIPLHWRTESSNPTTRRSGFPSWSWTGWEGVPVLNKGTWESTYSTEVEVEIEDRTELLSLKDFANSLSSREIPNTVRAKG